MNAPRPRSFRAAVLLFVLVAAACGGAENGSTATAPAALEPTGDAAAAPDGEPDLAGGAAGAPAPSGESGGGGNGVAIAGTVDPSAAQAAADSNIDSLAPADDVRLVEVLNVADGSVATLADAVWGDRPVLLWFWAPH